MKRQNVKTSKRQNPARATLIACCAAALLLQTSLLLGEEPPASAVRYVSSPRVLLWYEMGSASSAPTRVDLWFTGDQGKNWQRAELHDVLASPIAFDAPGDGLYGFFLVLHNDAGDSSPPPSAGTVPQQWIRVDRSAPVVQVLAVRPDLHFDANREIHLRWTTSDDDLPDRPVALHYRTEATKTFQPIADLLAARSAYGWVVPAEVNGRVEIRISATDRAGNTGTYLIDNLRIIDGRVRTGGNTGSSSNTADGQVKAAVDKTPPASGPLETMAMPRKAGERPMDSTAFRQASYDEPDAGATGPAGAANVEARKKYEMGTYYRLRGELALAIARFREALELDSSLLAARCDLAGLLLLTGDVDKAEAELQRVLTADPTYRGALRGLALVQTKRKNYESARETLDKLLLVEPRDAEAWLAYGDVMLFTGDREAARQAWSKADRFAENNDDLKKRSAKRLELYPEAK